MKPHAPTPGFPPPAERRWAWWMWWTWWGGVRLLCAAHGREPCRKYSPTRGME